MKEYKTPEVEIILFEEEDILTSSNLEGGDEDLEP